MFGESYYVHLYGGNVLQASSCYDLEDHIMKTTVILVMTFTVIGLYECETW